MKRVALIIISLSISIFGCTQTDTISDNIYQNNGNLGIGTINPSTPLHIVNSIHHGLIRIESPVYKENGKTHLLDKSIIHEIKYN